MDEVSTTKPQRDEGTPLECLSQRKDKSVGRIAIRFVQFRERPLDEDNLWASIKQIQDGLVAAELIPDDSPEEIQVNVEQRRPEGGKGEGIAIEIIYQEREVKNELV